MTKDEAKDVQLIKLSRVSPRYFIFKMWGLVAQQPLPEFVEYTKTGDPNTFKNEMFEPFIKGKHFTWQQNLILQTVELAVQGKAVKRISVVSGHGTGKSTILAMLILWFLFCFENAQVPCTAPTSAQMHDVLWKEVSLWLSKMPPHVKQKFIWTNGYVRIEESPETWFARAKTASKEDPEALAGVHGDHVMFVIDEASGVYEEIFNTAEGALTSGNILVIMISNGTRLVGYFYDSHHLDKENWQTLNLDSEQSPIVDKQFIQRITEKHGKDSDEYKIRVKGSFPQEEGVDDQGFVPLLVDADLREAQDVTLRGNIRLGIDPAGDGDDEAAQVGRDLFKAKVLALEKRSKPKTIAATAVNLITPLDIKGEDVYVDNFGEGANVSQEIALFNPKEPIRVNGVNVGDDPEDKEMFLNKRAELAWRMRKWIKAGGEFVGLAKWKEELLSLRFRRTLGKRSLIQLMDKKTMKKLKLNHGKSPNRVDALMLTFFKEDVVRTAPKPKAPYEPKTIYGG